MNESHLGAGAETRLPPSSSPPPPSESDSDAAATQCVLSPSEELSSTPTATASAKTIDAAATNEDDAATAASFASLLADHVSSDPALKVPVSTSRPAGRRLSRRSRNYDQHRISILSRRSSAASSLSETGGCGSGEGREGGEVANTATPSIPASANFDANTPPPCGSSGQNNRASSWGEHTSFLSAGQSAILPSAPSHRQASWYADALRSGMSELEIAQVFGLDHETDDGGGPGGDERKTRAAAAAQSDVNFDGGEGDDSDLFDSEEVLQQHRVLAILEARRMAEELLGKGWEERGRHRRRRPTPEEEEEEERLRVARFPIPDPPDPVIDPPPAVPNLPRRHPRDYRPPLIPPSPTSEALQPSPQEPLLVGRVVRRKNSHNDNVSGVPNRWSAAGDEAVRTDLRGPGDDAAIAGEKESEEEEEEEEEVVVVTCHGCRKSLEVGYLALIVRCPECASVSPAVPWWPLPASSSW